ncbi:DUF3017 domain-containing protein [Actinotalea sp. AC32]|nr:DUF3017 domain-containing protein [Actinotalea sp. AC32]
MTSPLTERHRAPALWLVTLAIGVACVAAVVEGARSAALVLVATLVGAALARLTRRGREPEGIAVRSTWFDVVVLTGLAVGIFVLQTAPGV